MEILVRKADLVKELSLVQGIVERKNSIPILSNVLAEARGGELRIAATDLDVSLRCGCAAQVVAEGAITLGAKKLYEIARSLPELLQAIAPADRDTLRAAQRAWLAYDQAQGGWDWSPAMHGEEGTSGPLNVAAGGLARRRERVCRLQSDLAFIREKAF